MNQLFRNCRVPLLCISSAMLLPACDRPISPPGPPTTIDAVSATTLADTVGTVAADSLVVRVTDTKGKPVPGISVAWTGPGTIMPAASTTDQQGLSRAAWTLGTKAGEQEAKATIGAGADAPSVRFTATAVPGPAVWARRQFATPFPRRILTVGDTVQLQQSWVFGDQYRNLFFAEPTWKSSNPQAVEIGTNGVATARSGGVSRITVSLDQARDSIMIVAGPLRYRELAGKCGITSSDSVVCGISAVSAGSPAFRTLSEGSASCAITIEGKAFCWGLNDSGQLGAGLVGTTWSGTPVPVAGDLTFSMLSSGAHVCGVTTTGAAYCWGLNDHQQLGAGLGTISSGVPAPVSGGLRFRAISAEGDLHTCGITTEGDAYCWGYNGTGQLGAGLDPAKVKDAPAPVPVTGGLKFQLIRTFGQSTCGLAEDGQAYCWGQIDHRTIGVAPDAMDTCSTINNPHPCRQTPALVQGGLRFQSLDASTGLTCGLTAEARFYCWGSLIGRATPGLMEGAPRLRSIDVGGNGIWDWQKDWNLYPGVCGLAEDGLAYCWNATHRWFKRPGQ